MTQYEIRYESGWRYRWVRERVRQVVREVAPVVEHVSGLPLPPQVVIRLVMIPLYGAESVAHLQRGVAADLRDFEDVDADALHRWLATHRRLSSVLWAFSRAVTVITAEGQPEVLLPPGGARRAGALGDVLYETLAHELTHLAQWQSAQRGDGRLFRVRGTGVPAAHGVADLALGEVMEGHASWVQDQVTTKLLGGPPQRGRTSWLYRRLRSKVSDHGQVFATGEDFVTHVHDVTGGTAVLDRIWRNPALAPTQQEITNPDAWLTRQGLTE